MIAIACTCLLLLCNNTILPFRPKSKSESQNFEVSWKNKFRLSWKVSWKSFKWVEFQNLKSLPGLVVTLVLRPSWFSSTALLPPWLDSHSHLHNPLDFNWDPTLMLPLFLNPAKPFCQPKKIISQSMHIILPNKIIQPEGIHHYTVSQKKETLYSCPYLC